MDNIVRIFIQYWEIKSKDIAVILIQCYVYNFDRVKLDNIVGIFLQYLEIKSEKDILQ